MSYRLRVHAYSPNPNALHCSIPGTDSFVEKYPEIVTDCEPAADDFDNILNPEIAQRVTKYISIIHTEHVLY